MDIKIGYKLSSEEHPAMDLVANARKAEEAGFDFALISDHFHPWIDRQGESPFVWAVLGGIARETQTLSVGTGVTCPSVRVHPAIVAHAASTVAAMMPGRFFLGLGSGENLNEHVHGDQWPQPAQRIEMLEEAIDVITELWKGEKTNHRGTYYTVQNARLYSLPDSPPPLIVAASGTKAAELAGRKADGVISTAPDDEVIKGFEKAGGSDKPRYAEVQVCYAAHEDDAKKTALEWWPNVGMGGNLSADLESPAHFDAVAELVRMEDIQDSISFGPDPEAHIEGIKKYVDAGYDHLCIHQIGPDQDSFISFYRDEVIPKIRQL
ncbi:MAG: TIGR03557 family F420-dependent LLM class oxidoreductase [Actinomycetota bacterium]|nr:TIGR03557 family F420-dependent LLM class oxidoreductase [Actinomycetota bacterium]